MNITILVQSYPPKLDSGSRLYSELAESLFDLGHNVNIITDHPSKEVSVYNSHDYFIQKPSKSVINGVKVIRVSSLSILSKIPGGKAIRYFLSCFLYVFEGSYLNSPDVILVYSPPLYLGLSGYILSKLKRTRFVINIQDLHPKVLFDSGVIKNRLIKKILIKIEDISYRKTHSIIVYSRGNKEYLLDREVNTEINIIPNWIDDAMMTAPDNKNSIRNQYGYQDKFVLSYAGTMQEAQGIEILVHTAEALREHKDIIFLLAGDGSSKVKMAEMIAKKELDNIVLLPVLPRERYVQFLYESDVCLLPLGSDTPLQTVPGKLADLMVSGNPIIAAVNKKGDAAHIIGKAGCGICVSPRDYKSFYEAVLKLYADKDYRLKLGANGQRYAKQYYSRRSCTRQYMEVLNSSRRQPLRISSEPIGKYNSSSHCHKK